MRKYAIVSFIACLFVVNAWAAGSARAAQGLGDILKKVEQNYDQMQAFSATFHQFTRSSAANAITTEASGKLYYQKPRQMHWEYEKPEAQVFVANHDLAWLYVPADRQLSLYDAKALFSSPLAQAFFDGFVELKKQFDVVLDSKQTSSGAAVLRLTPRQEDPNIKLLLLTIDLQTYRIVGVESHDALENSNRIVLDSQKPASHLDPKLFELNIPPGTAVLDVDQRELPPSEIEKLKQKLLSR